VPYSTDCLACQPRFQELLAAQPALARLWAALPRRQLAPGATLLAIGETAHHVWLVEQGLARLYYLSADGRECNKSFHAEGAWVGCGVPPQPVASAFAIAAMEPLQVVELSYAALTECQRESPLVQTVLNDGLSAVFARLAEREAELLLLDAPARYRAFLAEHAAIAARLPLHHVASYLGITNVALSRIRSRLGMVARRA